MRAGRDEGGRERPSGQRAGRALPRSRSLPSQASGSEPRGSAHAEAAERAERASRPEQQPSTVRRRWRGWLRAIHRDLGYLAIGLTVIYAVSGLAINHIGTAGWDPNFKSYERERVIAPIGLDVPDEEALARAQRELGVGTPRSWYRAGDELRLEYDYRAFVILGDSGQVIEQGRKPRFFLRVANWLHYNRGKQAWTYVADVYAILLLYLAVSGLFMIKGKMGLRWRGAAFALAGISVPVAYVVWSGGPEAASRKRPPPGLEATGAPPAAGAAPTTPDEPPSGEPDRPSGEPDDFPRLQPRRPDPPLPLPPRSP